MIVVPPIPPQLPDHLEEIFRPTAVINKNSTVDDLKVAAGQQEVIDYLRERVAEQDAPAHRERL